MSRDKRFSGRGRGVPGAAAALGCRGVGLSGDRTRVEVLYVLVEFGTMLIVVLLLLLYPAREPGTKYLAAGLAAYAAAVCFEAAGAQVLALGQLVSGHTLKHLAAAGGVGCIVRMIRARAILRTPHRPQPLA